MASKPNSSRVNLLFLLPKSSARCWTPLVAEFDADLGMQRERVLKLYRAILRAAKTHFRDQPETFADVYAEARTLFRKNASLRGAEEIERKLFEGESRLEMALHYGIPYPRQYHLSPGATPRSPRRVAYPRYMDSYVETLQPAGERCNTPPVDRPPIHPNGQDSFSRMKVGF
jgi:hypothetical protein